MIYNNKSLTHLQLETHGCLHITEATEALVLNHQGPILLIWFNFNPSMDK